MDQHEPLNDQISDLADAISVDDAHQSLTSVKAAASRRRRRRTAIGGTAAVAALIGGVVVVSSITGDGPADSISIDGAADTQTEPEADAPAGGGAAGTDDDAVPADTTSSDDIPAAAPSIASTRAEIISGSATAISIPGDAAQTQLEWIVPWQGGFLAGRVDYQPQPLPSELPEEVTALFSQEVLDLFVDGLPPTIDEATTMLSEAGLLDEVTQVLSEHPEANAAVFSSDRAVPEANVLFSADGIDWEPTEVTIPDGAYGLYGIQSTGTRLAVAIETFAEPPAGDLDPSGQTDYLPGISVATTTDLINWELTQIDVPARPADLHEAFYYSVSPGTLAVNDNGWVLTLNAWSDIQVESLLPADVAERVQSSMGGYGINYDDVEVVVEIMGGAPVVTTLIGDSDAPADTVEYVEPEVSETLTYTWAELGVDPSALETFEQRSGASAVTAVWGGAPQAVDGVDAWSIAAADTGFYTASGNTIGYSPDGVTWSDLAVPDDELTASAVKAVAGGALVFATDDEGATKVFRVSGPDQSWELLEVPGAPTSMFDVFGSQSSVPAMLVDGAEPIVPEPTEITVDADGYTMVMGQDGSIATVTVTDSAGDVVASEVYDWRSNGEPTVWRYGRNGIDILDADTGDVIVTFDNGVLETAYNEQTDRSDDVMDYAPDLWLVATVDGDRWLIEDLDADIDFNRVGPGALALSGNTLVVSLGGDWLRYDLS